MASVFRILNTLLLLVLVDVAAEIWTMTEFTEIQSCFVNTVHWKEILLDSFNGDVMGVPFAKVYSTHQLPMKESVQSSCNFHNVDYFKIRFNALEFPEKQYEFNHVEYVHSSKMLFDMSNNLLQRTPFEELQAAIKEADVISPFAATIIPQSFFFAALSDTATVCVSEFIHGFPLEMYVFTLDSDLEVFHFVMAMLGSLDTLMQLQIVHRDINPENLVVHFDQKTMRLSLVVFDFTWAISPGLQNTVPLPPTLNCVYRHPDGTHRNDCPSFGFIIRDMLSLYAMKVDVDWLSPLIDAMLDDKDGEEHSTPDTYELGMLLLDLYVTKNRESLQEDTSGRRGEGQVDIAADAYSSLELRRRELCQQPNFFAGKADWRAEGVGMDGASRDVIITGYQRFQIVNSPQAISLRPLTTSLIRKDELLSSILQGTVPGMTLMDIGGNVGYFCALAVQFGAAQATIVDMDSQYTSVATEAYQYLGSPFTERIQVENKKLSELDGSRITATTVTDPAGKSTVPGGGAEINNTHSYFDSTHELPYAADVVVALALMHWSYNCSETSGSLARTVGNLAIRARKMLIIEWIDPSDDAIKHENHLGMGGRGDDGERSMNHFRSLYTFQEFLSVMRRTFHCVVEVGDVTSTRRIFIGRRKHGRILSGAQSGSRSGVRKGRGYDPILGSEKYVQGDDWWLEHIAKRGLCLTIET